MRPKSLALLILALGCGLIASIGISEIIDSKGADEVSTETEPILIASQDVERNSVLTAENVQFKEWPIDTIPAGAVRDLAEVEGRRPLIRISSGTAIQQGMLGTGFARADEQIPPGYRVATVRVGIEDGSKLVRPGGRVDVQVYVRESSAIKRAGIQTFLQDVTVFAVDSDIGSEEGVDQPVEARSVSLLVTPLQAQKVTLASEIGKIRLVLRGAADDSPTNTDRVGIEELFGGPESGENGNALPLDANRLAALEKENEALRNHPANNRGPGEPPKMIIFRGTAASIVTFNADSPLPTVEEVDGGGAQNEWADEVENDESYEDETEDKTEDETEYETEEEETGEDD